MSAPANETLQQVQNSSHRGAEVLKFYRVLSCLCLIFISLRLACFESLLRLAVKIVNPPFQTVHQLSLHQQVFADFAEILFDLLKSVYKPFLTSESKAFPATTGVQLLRSEKPTTGASIPHRSIHRVMNCRVANAYGSLRPPQSF